MNYSDRIPDKEFFFDVYEDPHGNPIPKEVEAFDMHNHESDYAPGQGDKLVYGFGHETPTKLYAFYVRFPEKTDLLDHRNLLWHGDKPTSYSDQLAQAILNMKASDMDTETESGANHDI